MHEDLFGSRNALRGGRQVRWAIDVVKPTRDARPFLAQHLRGWADRDDTPNADDLHSLARWVENLSSGNPQMAILEATDALGFDDGSFRGGEEAEALIGGYDAGDDIAARETWLARFADAVRRYWA